METQTNEIQSTEKKGGNNIERNIIIGFLVLVFIVYINALYNGFYSEIITLIQNFPLKDLFSVFNVLIIAMFSILLFTPLMLIYLIKEAFVISKNENSNDVPRKV